MSRFWLFLAMVLSLAGSPVLADGRLVMWVGSNRDALALRTVAARYQASTGVVVTIATMDPLPDQLMAAAQLDEGPDLFLVRHDSMGTLAELGLIIPVDPPAQWREGILPVALDAIQFDGAIWGYPVAVDALHLIYNRALINAPPSAFEDIPALPLPVGNRRILWDYTNAYFTMPLLMAGGGFAFEKVNGAYDPARTGINTPGGIAGAEMLLSLIIGAYLPVPMTYQIMDDAMNGGRVAMVINGSWAWDNLAISGIDFGVAPIPAVNGHPSRSFVTVQALAINAASRNRELAIDFIETALTSDQGLGTWNANGALGALADTSAAAEQTNPHMVGLLAIAAVGVPLPNNPEMAVFWQSMRAALTDISTLNSTPADALHAAAARINLAIKPPDSG